jgi:hypothetical protein
MSGFGRRLKACRRFIADCCAASSVQPCHQRTVSSGLSETPIAFWWNGDAQLNEIFGGYTPQSRIKITGAEISAMQPPEGTSLMIDIVDENNVSLGRLSVLPAGLPYNRTTFSTLIVQGGHTIRAKITAIGATYAGGNIQYSLLVHPA